MIRAPQIDRSTTGEEGRAEKKCFQDVKDGLRKSMWNGEIIGV